ncbi:FkbM family methyltransferase [Azospirillum himalayense]|uniref:FkbM family methyltransferase n=1 Tax=Azospirillum himalayense TaxID=654847 RepID=A0ABW0FZU0_9PROT
MTSAPLFARGGTLTAALGDRLERLLIVDIGAAEYSGGQRPPYAPLLAAPRTTVLGFEPHDEARAATEVDAQRIILPHAVADGERHRFHLCAAPMTSSLLEPNTGWLERFEGLADLCRVVGTEAVDTVRLDDVVEAAEADFLKIDVQSATLLVLGGAERVLSRALLVHTEVEFGPIYQDAPKFGDVDRFLSARGFEFHHFLDFGTRRVLSGSHAFGQAATRQLWADAVFVPSFTRLDALDSGALLKLAVIAHDCYAAQDLAHACLTRVDARTGSDFAVAYRVAVLAEDTH